MHTDVRLGVPVHASVALSSITSQYEQLLASHPHRNGELIENTFQDYTCSRAAAITVPRL